MRISTVLFLFPILFFWVCLCSHVFVVSGFCLEDQQSSLLQFKNDLRIDDEVFSRTRSWKRSIPCGEWSGVTWDEEGHVIGLDLSGEFNTREIDNSSAVFNLHYLQNLNLAGTEFNYSIPPAMKNLKNLISLNLSTVGLMGQIPIEISQLTRLVTLDLSFNYDFSLSNKTQEHLNLQKLLQNLTSIKRLYLDGVSISAKGKEWSSALLALPNLEELSMSNCNLSGPIDSSLARLENLTKIYLDENDLSSSVPETFANFKRLSILSLSDCNLRGVFPSGIFQLRTLSHIDISFNDDIHGSLPDFPFSGSLQILIASYTSLSGVLPGSISKLSQLSEVDLSYCQLNGTLPNSITNLTKLIYLDLSNNTFIGPIPPFYMLKNLTHIDLSHNHLSGAVTSNHFLNLKNLVFLGLQNNILNGRIPSSLFELPLIKEIYLSFNHFDGQIDEFSTLPSSTLNILDLSNNQLEGLIPLSVFKLSGLQALSLSSNKINGIMKFDMIQTLPNLSTLDMSYNNLSNDENVRDINLSAFPNLNYLNLASCKLREFPMFMRNHSSLTILDLSNNQIQGLIPHWIWNLNLERLDLSNNFLKGFDGSLLNLTGNFYVLDLHSNQLQGQIPNFVSGSICLLDYSSNNFNSVVPSNVGHSLTYTSFFSLSKNNFHGTIPHSFCNSTILEVLDLSNNKFEGTIPECLTQSMHLNVLDLGNNMLSDKIPNTFSKSCAFKTLDLNRNKLSGLIPKSLANCKALEVLDLGNNQIEGPFLCSLMKISTLRVMVFHRNKLQGPLICPNTNGALPVLQILDLSFNNFSGLLPSKAFTTWEAMIHIVSKYKQIQFQAPTNDSKIYYQDSVEFRSKGLDMKFVKILTFLTSVDFSSNNFEGTIPRELMNLRGLHVLNLSNNAFSGQIPSSIENLQQLESLDLSSNSLTGEIPPQFASLLFLEFLNLSSNHLVGRIPTGTQLQSFNASSFQGNDGLYGPPLTSNDQKHEPLPLPAPRNHHTIDLKFITGMELGVVFGLGIIIGPIIFWRKWRIQYWKRVDNILCSIFPQLYLEYQRREGQMYTVLRWSR